MFYINIFGCCKASTHFHCPSSKVEAIVWICLQLTVQQLIFQKQEKDETPGRPSSTLTKWPSPPHHRSQSIHGASKSLSCTRSHEDSTHMHTLRVGHTRVLFCAYSIEENSLAPSWPRPNPLKMQSTCKYYKKIKCGRHLWFWDRKI